MSLEISAPTDGMVYNYRSSVPEDDRLSSLISPPLSGWMVRSDSSKVPVPR